MNTTRNVAALMLALTAVAACKKKPVVTPEPVRPSAPVASAPRVNTDSINAARAAEEARRKAAADAEDARRNAGAIAAAKAAIGQVIYFDYDKDEIRDDQKAALEAKIPVLTLNTNMRIRVLGNTDNRGSDEYNLALGQRRAATVKRYLVSRGIAESRIETVSFGEERPAMQGENEESWAKNRRDEFEIIAGADAIKVPRE
jgi:peptidoglycan-associated lipoprotein